MDNIIIYKDELTIAKLVEDNKVVYLSQAQLIESENNENLSKRKIDSKSNNE